MPGTQFRKTSLKYRPKYKYVPKYTGYSVNGNKIKICTYPNYVCTEIWVCDLKLRYMTQNMSGCSRRTAAGRSWTTRWRWWGTARRRTGAAAAATGSSRTRGEQPGGTADTWSWRRTSAARARAVSPWRRPTLSSLPRKKKDKLLLAWRRRKRRRNTSTSMAAARSHTEELVN